MTCTPLNIQPGLFINVNPWTNAPNTTFDGKTLTLTTGGGSPGIAVQQGGNSLFHSLLSNRNLHYMILGGKYLLILDIETGGLGNRTISLVDFSSSPWTEVNILTVTAMSSVALPVVNPSQGNGIVFLAYGQDGMQQTSIGIYRSDNGKILCSLGSIIPTGQTLGEATATNLIIHYSMGGSSFSQSCPLPKAVYSATPASNTFPDVYFGGCAFPTPTKQFTIKNTGTDCLTITSIANSLPFSVQSTSKTLPVSLGTNETLDIVIVFNPTTTGNWNPSNLIVATSEGNHNLTCIGKAVAAAFSIQFNWTTFNFGKIPVGQQVSAFPVLTITNNGSKPLTVSVPPLSVSGFSCAGFNGILNCGLTQTITITFTPQSVGLQSVILGVTSQAAGSPHNITLNGEGCISHAVIVVPSTAPIDLGQIQQGYRTVKFFEIQNTGDGPLTFNGDISGPDAMLFGLPDPNGSVTVAPQTRPFEADPVNPCGVLTAGNGKVVVAISFFASAPPSVMPKNATLTISGHNATNVPSNMKWVFPLTAVITAPVALDVALVVDHSGSMNDSLGSRVKIDAAVSASQLFVELLRPDLDDRIALVRFNHQPDVLVPITSVSSTVAPTQNQIGTTVQTGIPPAAGNTAIAGGTMTGIKEIQKPRTTVPPVLTQAAVVLTDGIENTGFEDPSGSGNWFSIIAGSMQKPLPQTGTVSTSQMPKPSGIKIYAIGIGKDSDIDPTQLGALATSAQDFFRVNQDLTGTQYFLLEKYYTQIFMDVVGTSPISDPMYWISPGQTQEIEFDVLRGDVDALIVIFDYQGLRLPFYCISPKGEIIDPSRIPPGFQLRSGWTSQARFVEFKMPLFEPDRYAGRWKVVIQHQGRVCMGPPVSKQDSVGFLPRDCKSNKNPVLYGIAIGVGSNFRMVPFVTPNPVYVGDTILLTALVSEAGLPVTGCNVTVSATSPSGSTWAMTLPDDGTHSDGIADDGEYANSFTHTYEAGTYHFLFRVTGYSRDGEPVVREVARDKAVLSKAPGSDGSGKLNDDECCRRLLKEIEVQTSLLQVILKREKRS